jgi:adenylosuccinate lyase
MIERYEHPEIARIWGNPHKLLLWQQTELAVIRGRAEQGQIPGEVAQAIIQRLEATPIDTAWWLEKEKETSHDLIAFIQERQRHLPPDQRSELHKGMTSYDTEEPAFALMLQDSLAVVIEAYDRLEEAMRALSLTHRYTLMLGRTHGQGAEPMSFGKRVITWICEMREAGHQMTLVSPNLNQTKLSGAIGSYTGISPELERLALAHLRLKPYYGATQILPRQLYLPIADALVLLAQALRKIAGDIRLGARSGQPIYQEPFGRKQRGSSRMPHKKNTILCERADGEADMVIGFRDIITTTCRTWEERDISQSCKERVAWPDLFHAILQLLADVTKVVSGLQVYPDAMLYEIIKSCGCYASGPATEYLAEVGQEYGIDADTAYLIVQVAAFNAFSPTRAEKKSGLRTTIATSHHDAMRLLNIAEQLPRRPVVSIEQLIPKADLWPVDELDLTGEEIETWNAALQKIFANEAVRGEWHRPF